jgi:hypothetical protein
MHVKKLILPVTDQEIYFHDEVCEIETTFFLYLLHIRALVNIFFILLQPVHQSQLMLNHYNVTHQKLTTNVKYMGSSKIFRFR